MKRDAFTATRMEKTALQAVEGVQFYVTPQGKFLCELNGQWYQNNTLNSLKNEIKKLSNPVRVIVVEGSYYPAAPAIEEAIAIEDRRVRTTKKLHAFNTRIFPYDEEFFDELAAIDGRYRAVLREWSDALGRKQFSEADLKAAREPSGIAEADLL